MKNYENNNYWKDDDDGWLSVQTRNVRNKDDMKQRWIIIKI